jgi:PhzF family phenazine biosynthesis protein
MADRLLSSRIEDFISVFSWRWLWDESGMERRRILWNAGIPALLFSLAFGPHRPIYVRIPGTGFAWSSWCSRKSLTANGYYMLVAALPRWVHYWLNQNLIMRLPYFVVDAFASRPFAGNPAGVCPLEQWLPDTLLQQIAAENNLSETAFFVPEGEAWHLRWFTPAVEVDLCGHATLASAFVLFAELGCTHDQIRFRTKSGFVAAERRGELIELDFPAWKPASTPASEALMRGLGKAPREVLRSRDLLAVYDSQAEVAALAPDLALLETLDSLGVIVTAPGEDADFVSRFFAPRAGIPEDPVTGSAHSTLIPYWAARLGKADLFARQISRRGGELYCKHLGERVAIGGRAVIYSRGQIEIPV